MRTIVKASLRFRWIVLFLAASIPTAATVAPNVPANTRIIAGMLKNAAGEVPSMNAAPRMPTQATTMPMAVAAFTTG